jgi:hypothetical protein
VSLAELLAAHELDDEGVEALLRWASERSTEIVSSLDDPELAALLVVGARMPANYEPRATPSAESDAIPSEVAAVETLDPAEYEDDDDDEFSIDLDDDDGDDGDDQYGPEIRSSAVISRRSSTTRRRRCRRKARFEPAIPRFGWMTRATPAKRTKKTVRTSS